jgi:hypothetical protein
LHHVFLFFFVSKFSSLPISISRCLIFYAIQIFFCLLVINSWYYLLVVGINCKLFTMSLFIWFNVHSTFFFSLLSLHLMSLLLLHLSKFLYSFHIISIPIVVAFKESTTSNANVKMQLGPNTN